jgi:hypothetical protein
MRFFSVTSSADGRAVQAQLVSGVGVLFQAMGIVQMASEAIQRDASDDVADAWTLDGAYALLSSVAGRLNQQHGRAGVLAV